MDDSFKIFCFLFVLVLIWTYSIYYITRMVCDSEFYKRKMEEEKNNVEWAHETGEQLAAFISCSSPYHFST